MPLTLSPHPPAVEAAAVERLSQFRSQPRQVRGLLGTDRDLGAVVLAAPHTGHLLNPDLLAGGGAVAAAEPYARRYLLVEGRRAIGSLDVAPPVGEDGLSVARLGAGVLDEALLAALREAHQRLAADDAPFEPRYLLLPDVYFAALWLHGPGERVVPLGPGREEPANRRPYPAAEIEPILARLVAENRQSGDEQ